MERPNWRMRFPMAAQRARQNERVATGGGMRVIPAIDLKDGRCVRLRQGDMAAETVYSNDVPSVAGRWQQQGADLIHVVDLNGAVDGVPKNLPQIEAVMKTVSVKVQVGGGIRTIETVRRYLHAGVARVVLGHGRPHGSNVSCAGLSGVPSAYLVGTRRARREGRGEGLDCGVRNEGHQSA
jgi:uncharacterized protein related to proFAR isomerase